VWGKLKRIKDIKVQWTWSHDDKSNKSKRRQNDASKN